MADKARFQDSRQRYLRFVQTTDEKQVVARRIEAELARIQPDGVLRLLDAGTGDGTILLRVLRGAHRRFPDRPHIVTGREISVEDLRLTLEKLPGRLSEHPDTALVLTNLGNRELAALEPLDPEAARRLEWHAIALPGVTAADWQEALDALDPLVNRLWRMDKRDGARLRPVTPAVLVLWRQDRSERLAPLLPRRGAVPPQDLVIASQAWRSRASSRSKARTVVAPLARTLAPGGRLVLVQSCGGDPALEIVEAVWPGEQPFPESRHAILAETATALDGLADRFEMLPGTDEEARFTFRMYPTGGEGDEESGIATSPVEAAWNDATYVGQIEDERVAQAEQDDRHRTAVEAVLARHGGLWFNDEAFVVARRREAQ